MNTVYSAEIRSKSTGHIVDKYRLTESELKMLIRHHKDEYTVLATDEDGNEVTLKQRQIVAV